MQHSLIILAISCLTMSLYSMESLPPRQLIAENVLSIPANSLCMKRYAILCLFKGASKNWHNDIYKILDTDNNNLMDIPSHLEPTAVSNDKIFFINYKNNMLLIQRISPEGVIEKYAGIKVSKHIVPHDHIFIAPNNKYLFLSGSNNTGQTFAIIINIQETKRIAVIPVTKNFTTSWHQRGNVLKISEKITTKDEHTYAPFTTNSTNHRVKIYESATGKLIKEETHNEDACVSSEPDSSDSEEERINTIYYPKKIIKKFLNIDEFNNSFTFIKNHTAVLWIDENNNCWRQNLDRLH